MSLSILFWVVFIVALIFGAYGSYAPQWPGSRFGGWVSIVLFGILGYAVFGAAVHR